MNNFLRALFLIIILSANNSFAAQNDDSDSKDKFSEVTDQKEMDYIITDFQNGLKGLGSAATIKSCEHITDYVIIGGPGRDYSFGGFCILLVNGKSYVTSMCNDNLVGKFSIGGAQHDIKEFIKNNCPPGG